MNDFYSKHVNKSVRKESLLENHTWLIYFFYPMVYTPNKEKFRIKLENLGNIEPGNMSQAVSEREYVCVCGGEMLFREYVLCFCCCSVV